MRCRGRAVAAARASAKPTHSSNSKSSIIRSCARSLTCLLQLRFQGIAVDAVVRLVQLVREVVHLVDGVARDDPQRLRLLPSPVLLARERLRERRVRRLHGAGVREGRAALLLTEDLEDHAASLACGSVARGKPCFPRGPPSRRRRCSAPANSFGGTCRFPRAPSWRRDPVTPLRRGRRCAPTPLARACAGGSRAAPASSARAR